MHDNALFIDIGMPSDYLSVKTKKFDELRANGGDIDETNQQFTS